MERRDYTNMVRNMTNALANGIMDRDTWYRNVELGTARNIANYVLAQSDATASSRKTCQNVLDAIAAFQSERYW